MAHFRRAALPLALWLAACAPTTAVAPRPALTVQARETITGSVTVDVDDVPEEAVCSYSEGGEELCIAGFRSAYSDGVSQVMQAFIRPGAGPRYRALYRIIDFSQVPENVNVLGRGVRILLLLRWQFALTDNRGNKIVYVERTTTAPRLLGDPSELQAISGELVTTSLNDLVIALNDAGIHVPDAQRVFPVPTPEPQR